MDNQTLNEFIELIKTLNITVKNEDKKIKEKANILLSDVLDKLKESLPKILEYKSFEEHLLELDKIRNKRK